MSSLIKQVFILLLSFSSSLVCIADQTKCLSLNDDPCMFRPTLIDLNPVELKYYPFMISLDSCNVMETVISYLLKCVFQKKQDTNTEVFNIITNKNEAKTMTKRISCDCICKFNSTTFNSNPNWNNEISQFQCQNNCTCKKDYCRNPSTCICENRKYLKSIADTSVIAYDEIISVMNIVSTTMTYTIATNASINADNKKVR